jgi:hypothetical protein
MTSTTGMGASSARGDRSSALALHAPVIDARHPPGRRATRNICCSLAQNRDHALPQPASRLLAVIRGVRTEARRAAREQHASGPPRATRVLAEQISRRTNNRAAQLESGAARALSILSLCGRFYLAAHAAARTAASHTPRTHRRGDGQEVR